LNKRENCEAIRNALDTALSGLQDDPLLARRVIAEAERAKKAKRRIPGALGFARSVAAVAAALLIAFAGGSLLSRGWMTGTQSEDEQQYLLSSHSGPDVGSQAVASEEMEDITIIADTVEEIVKQVGDIPPMPSWMPEDWRIQDCYFSKNVVFTQFSVYYECQGEQIFSFTTTEYAEDAAVSSAIEQNHRGKVMDIAGKSVYVTKNIDLDVYVWTEGFRMYLLDGTADFDDVARMIESIET